MKNTNTSTALQLVPAAPTVQKKKPVKRHQKKQRHTVLEVRQNIRHEIANVRTCAKTVGFFSVAIAFFIVCLGDEIRYAVDPIAGFTVMAGGIGLGLIGLLLALCISLVADEIQRQLSRLSKEV